MCPLDMACYSDERTPYPNWLNARSRRLARRHQCRSVTRSARNAIIAVAFQAVIVRHTNPAEQMVP